MKEPGPSSDHTGCTSHGSPVYGSPRKFSAQDCGQAQNQSSEISSPGSYSETTFGNAAMLPNLPSDMSFPGSCIQQLQTPIADPTLKAAGTYTNMQTPQTYPAEDKQKKKVGRPIAYKGDPCAPNLTDAERRRIKRRIANRESARRVRARRQETLEELQVKMDQINMHNAQMVRHIAEVEGHSALLKGQLQECESQWNKAIADNTRLHQQVSLLNSKAHEQAKHASRAPSAQQTRDNKPNVACSESGNCAHAFNTAPVTGISCALIDELPTMALPFPESMLLPPMYDEDCPPFLL